AVRAALESLQTERQGLRVLRERSRRPPVDVPGELIEEDDQRELPGRRRGPMIQLASRCTFEVGLERLAAAAVDLDAGPEPLRPWRSGRPPGRRPRRDRGAACAPRAQRSPEWRLPSPPWR